MYVRCPKCGHQPLPADQALPAACPACGVILAKVAAASSDLESGAVMGAGQPRQAFQRAGPELIDETGWRAVLLRVPERVDTLAFQGRLALLAGFTLWGLWLMTRSVAEGEMNQSFIHAPLLVFHEAGHVLFMPLGEWMTVAGGTLLQWLMPVAMGAALLRHNRDPYGAALALWLLGVSVMDSAAYLYDALHPQLILLGGHTGDDGPHDFIYLLESLNLRHRAQGLGLLMHKLGAAVMLLALAWAGVLLRLQSRQRAGVVLHE